MCPSCVQWLLNRRTNPWYNAKWNMLLIRTQNHLLQRGQSLSIHLLLHYTGLLELLLWWHLFSHEVFYGIPQWFVQECHIYDRCKIYTDVAFFGLITSWCAVDHVVWMKNKSCDDRTESCVQRKTVYFSPCSIASSYSLLYSTHHKYWLTPCQFWCFNPREIGLTVSRAGIFKKY